MACHKRRTEALSVKKVFLSRCIVPSISDMSHFFYAYSKLGMGGSWRVVTRHACAFLFLCFSTAIGSCQIKQINCIHAAPSSVHQARIDRKCWQQKRERHIVARARAKVLGIQLRSFSLHVSNPSSFRFFSLSLLLNLVQQMTNLMNVSSSDPLQYYIERCEKGRPNREGISPKREELSLNREERSRNLEELSLNCEERSRNCKELSLNREEKSPTRKELSLNREERSRNRKELSLNREEGKSKPQRAKPKPRRENPKPQRAKPKPRREKPKQRRANPKPRREKPKPQRAKPKPRREKPKPQRAKPKPRREKPKPQRAKPKPRREKPKQQRAKPKPP
ncbi:unnamed protein product [Acanthosepion pharaonis]|uniref:Uncharacterized protein n=1 Tax=Acanthosepion pharaonis TaxID=158019 RepID=A0A812EJX2_ACAPH|nr:unnamed protein product [Sepia pharaonis]